MIPNCTTEGPMAWPFWTFYQMSGVVLTEQVVPNALGQLSRATPISSQISLACQRAKSGRRIYSGA